MSTLDFYLIGPRRAQAAKSVRFFLVSTQTAGAGMHKPFSLLADNEWVKMLTRPENTLVECLKSTTSWQIVSVSSFSQPQRSFKGHGCFVCLRFVSQKSASADLELVGFGMLLSAQGCFSRAGTCQHRGLSPDFTVKNNSEDQPTDQLISTCNS